MSVQLGKRRIAFVAPNFHPRICGIGDHSARLAAELQGRGHDVVVFSREPAQRHPDAPELEVHDVPGRLPVVVGQRIAAALTRWRPTDVILQYTPQMWNAWRFGSAALPLVAWQARRTGARVTVIAHEPFVPWNRRPDLLAAAALQRAGFAALLASSHNLFVTTQTRVGPVTPYRTALGLSPPRVSRVGANALPLDPASRAQSGRDGRAGPRLGIFSTAAVGKRFDVILKAFERIGSEFPAAELLLIGDLGPTGRSGVREINELVSRHPFSARIRLTGRLSLPEIAAEIANLDVYLFPMNTGANTRSCTLPVALGSALPVVAIQGIETDAALFRDGETIVFARDLSAGAFSDATLRLLRDPLLMARVGQGARELYVEHLSWPRIADDLLASI